MAANPDEASLGELFSEMTSDLGLLVRKEIELAKTETKEELTRAGRGAAMFGAAAVAGMLALLLVSFAAAWGLAVVIPTGWAFLVIGVIYGVVAAVVALRGRDQMKRVGAPEQTIQTLKEDVQWARARTS
ncbi:MAG TPA: phage holin family protein [Acidimicrobiia bacterium]|nr:phage holin family protein [Acidimicrobiia bacterium]